MARIPLDNLYSCHEEIPVGLAIYYIHSQDGSERRGTIVSRETARQSGYSDHFDFRGVTPVFGLWRDTEVGWMPMDKCYVTVAVVCGECGVSVPQATLQDYLCVECRQKLDTAYCTG